MSYQYKPCVLDKLTFYEKIPDEKTPDWESNVQTLQVTKVSWLTLEIDNMIVQYPSFEHNQIRPNSVCCNNPGNYHILFACFYFSKCMMSRNVYTFENAVTKGFVQSFLRRQVYSLPHKAYFYIQCVVEFWHAIKFGGANRNMIYAFLLRIGKMWSSVRYVWLLH